MKQEEKLQNQIKEAGLLKSFVADKVGISSAHLSMMFKNGMPEEVRNKITKIVDQARKISV